MALLRPRRLLAIAALAVAGLIAFVLAYFEPQKLFINDVVHEPLPSLAAPVASRAVTSLGLV